MAGPFYLDGTRPDDTGDGLSWANAKKTWAAVHALLGGADGEILYIANTHAETGIPFATYNFVGSQAAPLKIISAETTGTTYLAGASLTFTTGTTYLEPKGEVVNVYGVEFVTAGSLYISHIGNYVDCLFETVGGGLRDFRVRQGRKRFDNCTFTVDTSTSSLLLTNEVVAHFAGCSTGAGWVGTSFLKSWTPGAVVRFDSCDFSSMPGSSSLVNNSGWDDNDDNSIVFSGCEAPANFSLVSDAIAYTSSRVEAYSVSDATNGIQEFEVADGAGVAVDEITIVRNATYDGTTPYSIKITPTALATFDTPFRMKIFERYCTANPTFTVHMVHGTDATLLDSEVWLEIDYPDATTPAMRKIDVTSRGGSITTAGSSLTTDTGGGSEWTSPPASPAYDEITEAISGGAAGVHRITLCYAPAATTPVLYVDPRVEVA